MTPGRQAWRLGRKDSWMAIACSIVAACTPGPARADELLLPEVGSRVRVSSTGPESARLVGTLSAIDAKSLTVVPQDGRQPRVVARQDLVRLERSVRPSRKSKGAVIGFAVGLAAAFGKVAIAGGCNDGCNGENVAAAGLLALSTAVVGAIAAPGERWEDAPPGPQPGRARLSSPAGFPVRLVPQLGRRTGLVLVASF